jgi:regulator of protease activity HflC (stomatin/prohibitin superfamily)
MFLIVLAVIILIAGFVLQASEKTRTVSRILKIVAGVMIIVGLAASCVVQIEAGQVGVPSLFGRVSGRILTSGLNLVNPFVVVKKFDIRTQNYTMAGQYDEGDRQGEDAMRVLTSDGLELTLDVSILYRVLPEQGS